MGLHSTINSMAVILLMDPLLRKVSARRVQAVGSSANT